MIKRLGRGQGAGEEIDAIGRKEIERLIEELDFREVIESAYKGFSKGCKSGYAVIRLEDGALGFESLGQNEENQACDNDYITIYEFDQNFDESEFETDDIDEIFDELECTDNYNYTKIKQQLDDWYVTDYCSQPSVDKCIECSLCNYNRDCKNNKIMMDGD